MLTLSKKYDRLGLAILIVYALSSLGIVYTSVIDQWTGDVWQFTALLSVLCAVALAIVVRRGMQPSRLRTMLMSGFLIAGFGFLMRLLTNSYFDSWLALAWIGVDISLAGFMTVQSLKRYRMYLLAVMIVPIGYIAQMLDHLAFTGTVVLVLATIVASTAASVDRRGVFVPSTARVLMLGFGFLGENAVIAYTATQSATLGGEADRLAGAFVCLALAKITLTAGAILHYRETTRDYIGRVHEVICEHCNKTTTTESPLCGKCGEPLGLSAVDELERRTSNGSTDD